MNNLDLFPDFKDFLKALNTSKVKYLLVGGYSVILHGYSRSTMDMDIWMEKSEENYLKLTQAFQSFKMPTFDMTKENFLHNKNMDVFKFGRPPVSIDILNQVKGLNFPDAWMNRVQKRINSIPIQLISKQDLLKAKKAAGRPKDLDDIQNLES